MKVYKDKVMKEYSNMKIGGIAKEYIVIEDKNEIKDIITTRDRYFLLGNGTNTLMSDKYLDISFISLKELNDISIEKVDNEYTYVRVQAGRDFKEFIKYMEDNNLSGLENMAGIPGSIGGLVNMNGGAYGTEIFDIVDRVEIADNKGNIYDISADELGAKYRTTAIKENKWIVISVLLKMKKGYDKACVEDKLQQRQDKHPLDYPNLGSTFKNPKGTFAAQLISDAGLKGTTIGGARISDKHPNFITNIGNATFKDILDILALVKKEIKEKNKIELETEIIIIE